MWKEADEEVNQLFDLIAQVHMKMDRESPSSHKQRASLNLRQCTWEQVMGEVQSLATRWSTSPKKSSKMMRYLEKLGQNSDAFKSWLELLPAGDYGSRYENSICLSGLNLASFYADFTHSICGVFTIAVGVRYNLTRIFFDGGFSLPELNKTEKWLTLFRLLVPSQK